MGSCPSQCIPTNLPGASLGDRAERDSVSKGPGHKKKKKKKGPPHISGSMEAKRTLREVAKYIKEYADYGADKGKVLGEGRGLGENTQE